MHKDQKKKMIVTLWGNHSVTHSIEGSCIYLTAGMADIR